LDIRPTSGSFDNSRDSRTTVRRRLQRRIGVLIDKMGVLSRSKTLSTRKHIHGFKEIRFPLTVRAEKKIKPRPQCDLLHRKVSKLGDPEIG
jgi:hypothetical protein